MHPKIRVSILIVVLLVTSLALISCGAIEDDNNQPAIEPITDKTLDVGDETTAEVNITDADLDDTHIISASSEDGSVATVSVDAAVITVTGKAKGIATITVSVTDDSGQDNAAATPVTFKVTVNEPPPPIRANRVCEVGMTLGPGESCGYGPLVVFSVREDGSACRASSQPIFHNVFGIDVRIDNPSICGNHDIGRDDFFNTIFSASKNEDGTWTIKKVPAFNIY